MRRFLILLIRFYQLTLSPYIGGQCRFHPSCSNYAIEALGSHGTLAGSWLLIKRIARCQPLCRGGFDPVPEPKRASKFSTPN